MDYAHDGHSVHLVVYHIIWCPKRRRKVLVGPIPTLLEQIVREVAAEHDWTVIELAIQPDHVHLLVGLKATHCLADVMRELKKASSEWVHQQIGLRTFAWQEGYAAFTVSAPTRPAVQKYIANQEEHHRARSSRDELLELLAKAGIEYNAQYFE